MTPDVWEGGGQFFMGEQSSSTLTIGQLARRAGVPTSTLRYYEAEGLLEPAGRTESGYRYYAPEAVQTLRFIQRAQRFGFALADVRALLDGLRLRNLNDTAVVAIAEQRFLDIERRLTELLMQRHEMQHFLLDFRRHMRDQAGASSELFDRLVDRVCTGLADPSPDGALGPLLEYTGCILAGEDGQALLATLRGRHVHTWQKGDAYYILVVGHDSDVEKALRALIALETRCVMDLAIDVSGHEEGYLLTVRGENAFIYPRLFLSLEGERAGPPPNPDARV